MIANSDIVEFIASIKMQPLVKKFTISSKIISKMLLANNENDTTK